LEKTANTEGLAASKIVSISLNMKFSTMETSANVKNFKIIVFEVKYDLNSKTVLKMINQ
jgi:hypothetical protein